MAQTQAKDATVIVMDTAMATVTGTAMDTDTMRKSESSRKRVSENSFSIATSATEVQAHAV